MGCVYRYTDLEDGVIKYVGIVWSENRTLKQRVKEHAMNDSWCKNKSWLIEFIEENINSRTDAEYFESHYISLYETDKWFNQKKSGWGKSSFLPERTDWKVYTSSPYQISVEMLLEKEIEVEKELLEKLKEQVSVKRRKIKEYDEILENKKQEIKSYENAANKMLKIVADGGEIRTFNEILNIIDSRAATYKEYTRGIYTKSSIENWERMCGAIMVVRGDLYKYFYGVDDNFTANNLISSS